LRDLGQLDERDYQTYVSLFRNMSNFMCRPNLIVYLDVKPTKSLERVHTRNRGVESGLTLAYLERLYGNYEEFIGEISRTIPVLRVEWNEFWETEKLADSISKAYTQHSFIRELTERV